jgi:thiamine-monophosphate kinase
MGQDGAGELEVIRRIRETAKTRNAAVRVGIGDDCAILKPQPGHELVITTDFCLEGRHFRRDWHTAESAGHRCLARGLSDVAAMGARPLAAFLSIALPKGFDEEWFAGFMRGFEALGEEFGVQLAGGDTAEATGEDVIADVVVIGTTEKMRSLRRLGARVGDGIYVTGTLGGSAAELQSMREGRAWEFASRPQTYPEPQVAVGMALAKRELATSCMDLSDGLSSDLRQLCRESGVRASIQTEALPVGEGATLKQALDGGEDYELLFTAMAGVKVPKLIVGVAVTRIGTVVDGEGPLVEILGGDEWQAGGWEHLSGNGRWGGTR